jgi:hypothetical protein
VKDLVVEWSLWKTKNVAMPTFLLKVFFELLMNVFFQWLSSDSVDWVILELNIIFLESFGGQVHLEG